MFLMFLEMVYESRISQLLFLMFLESFSFRVSVLAGGSLCFCLGSSHWFVGTVCDVTNEVKQH